MALQSFWFSVDGVIKSAMTSNRDIAFQQMKKHYPDAKKIEDIDIVAEQAKRADEASKLENVAANLK